MIRNNQNTGQLTGLNLVRLQYFYATVLHEEERNDALMTADVWIIAGGNLDHNMFHSQNHDSHYQRTLRVAQELLQVYDDETTSIQENYNEYIKEAKMAHYQ